MRQKRLFEVEVKNRTSKKEAEILKQVLTDLGFLYVDSFTLIDHHLPKMQKWSRRLRKKQSKGVCKYIYSRKKVVEREGNLKVTEERECFAVRMADKLARQATQVSNPRKRHVYEGVFANKLFSVTIDDVSERGKYSGFYWEVETLVDSTSQIASAKNDVKKLEMVLYRLMHRGNKECNSCSEETLSHRKMEKLSREK